MNGASTTEALMKRANDSLNNADALSEPAFPPSAQPDSPAGPPDLAADSAAGPSDSAAAGPSAEALALPELDPMKYVDGGLRAVRGATARYPTVVVFGFIFVSLVVICPPYVQDRKSRRLSLRSATAATVLFTGIFKFTLNYFVL